MAIYKNGESYQDEKRRASDISTALLTDAHLNSDIVDLIKFASTAQAQIDAIKNILAIDIYSISPSVKVDVLRKILNVEEDT